MLEHRTTRVLLIDAGDFTLLALATCMLRRTGRQAEVGTTKTQMFQGEVYYVGIKQPFGG